MMHDGKQKDKCALCGKLLVGNDGGDGNTTTTTTTKNIIIIEEIIQNTHYKFDTRDCATMFKRFLGVYGNEFQPFLGDQQYISDPFWDRVVPKENEIKELEEEEGGKKLANHDKDDSRTNQNSTKKSSKLEVVVIKDSFQVQNLINQLIESAEDDISLAIPTTAAEIFFYHQGQTSSSSVSCSMFFQLIKDVAAANKQLNVKILTNAQIRKKGSQEQEDNQDILSTIKREELSNIHVKYIEQDYSSLNENMVILVVDRKASLAIELEDEERKRAAAPRASHRLIKLATYSNNKSTVLSYVSIFESLWKEIELNEKITDLLEEIKRRENIVKDFINTAAHELRAPIQPVLGLAQILQSRKNVDSKEQEELLTIIIRNARKLNILTDNLLDLTKIESRTLKLEKEIFSLPEMIFDAIADMKSQLTSNQITVNVNYKSNHYEKDMVGNANNIDQKYSHHHDDISPFLVNADKTRIMQVISNLLFNAIKFTKRGNIEISLEKKNRNSRKEEEGDVIVSFKDSGAGIDPEVIDTMFEKFVTKSNKGTGLGLFISRSIIEAHGGSIWAKNNPDGKGATVSFSLPFNQ